MKRQYQHEDHNRQDKAKKATYKDAFADSYDPGGSHGLTIRMADCFNSAGVRKYRTQLRLEAVAFIERSLRATMLQVEGFQFRLHMSVSQFATANKLSPAEAPAVYQRILEEAHKQLMMTKNSALKADFEVAVLDSSPEKMKTALRIPFKLFLQPVKPIPWEMYKKLRLRVL